MPRLDVTLPDLHISQWDVFDSLARFRVLACGRRWGKTRLGSVLTVAGALQGKRAWWVAPSYKVGAVGWRLITQLAYQMPGVEIKKAERSIFFPAGGEVSVRSADNPDSLRGEGLDLVVMDECAFIQEAAWSEALRPALSDRLGGAVFISTPKGRNWFWRMFQRGIAGDYDDWASWQLPTADNPHIDAAEIEAARRSLPERIYRQEYLAEFIDDAGGVFRRVMEAATATPQPGPADGHEYAIGVDWGKHNDYTVLTVLDLTSKSVAYIDRFNMIDYQVQVQRLAALNQKYRPLEIIAEQNSIGDPLIEQLQRAGMPVRPFTTTNASKTQVIDELARAFEFGELEIIKEPQLVAELQAYEMERLPSGVFRYNAPDGMHDDMVISLALAWHAVSDAAWYFA